MGIIRQLNRSLSTTIFLNVVFGVLWLVLSFLLESENKDVEITIFNSITLFSMPYFLSIIVQLIIFLLLVFFVYKFIFLQYLTITTYLPFSVMMLFGAVFKSAHLFGNQTFATIFLLLAIWQFIKINTRKENSTIVLNTFWLLIISTFFVSEFVYLIPVFIFGFFYFIEFKIKTLMVMIFAILMPVLSALGLCFLLDRIDLFNNFFIKLYNFNFEINIKLFETYTAILALISVIFVLFSLFFFLRNINNYKFQTRKFTFFFVILWLSIIFLILFLQNNYSNFILIYIILVSFFISLNLTNLQNKRTKN